MTLNDFAVETMSLAGWFEQEAGNYVEALDLFEEAVRVCAPAFDTHRMDVAADNLMLFMAQMERWEDAARLDGFHLANRSRPEPEVYVRHNQHYRDDYRAALADRADGLMGEGADMTGEQMYQYMLTAISETRAQLPTA